MANEFVKCRYKHCKHPDEPLLRENAVRSGSAYYHSDCFKEREGINELVNYYVENFDKEPVMAMLRKTINTIVITRKNPVEKVLFAMRYAKANNIPVRHPAGLYYIIKEEKMLDRWEASQKPKVSDEDFKVEEDLAPVDGYATEGKVNDFGRILK